MSDLIDTTEMYLRTIYELVEEDIVPLRARIAERLHQSGPTVSQTVARMERDGLVTVEGDRHLELTTEGMRLATRVMRKHRLAEVLLTDVIGLDWELVHAEACRWEHVMSETVERRLVELLDHPTESPYGNPIPGLDELGESGQADEFMDGMVSLAEVTTKVGDQASRPRPPHLRGAAEGRGPDVHPAPHRRAARTRSSASRAPRTACSSAPAARPPRSTSRPPPTSSWGSSRRSGRYTRSTGYHDVRVVATPSSGRNDAEVSRPGRRGTPNSRPRPCTSPARRRGYLPRLTITTGVPALAARRTNRKPLITVSDVPTHEQGAGRAERVDGLVAARHPRRGHVLAEEHHVGLEHAAARAAGHHEAGRVVQVDVAVGAGGGGGVARRTQSGLSCGHPRLERMPRGVTARQDRQTTSAIRPCRATRRARAGALVQAVDVLGDQQRRGRAVRRATVTGVGRRAAASATSRGGCAPSSAAGASCPDTNSW